MAICSSRRAFVGGVSAAALALTYMSRGVYAQSRVGQLKLLCGFPPGSIPDLVARQISANLAGHYASGCLVENRPGAAGQIAVTTLKNGPADGSVLLVAPGAVATIYPSTYSKLTYDPVADLVPVWGAAEAVLAVAVGPAVPAEVIDVPALVRWMMANPQQANIGSPGVGTPPHLLEAILFRRAGVKWTHVAYAGGPGAINDLIGGSIAGLALPEGILRPHHEARKLRIIATSGVTRSVYLPSTPTLIEQGFDKVAVTDWFGMFLPGATRPEVVDAAASGIGKALATADFSTALATTGISVNSMSLAAEKARISSERRQWEIAVKENGIHAD